MATRTSDVENEFPGVPGSPTVSGAWGTYWIAFLRLTVGWWFFHAGVTKLLTDGLNFTYGPAYLEGMAGTSLGPLAAWMGENLAWLVKPGVPLFETLIGLALMLGLFTRLASAGGAFFMTLFWVGNAEFGHGVVNGNLMGLLLFLTMIVLAAGRYYGLDAYVERTGIVCDYPRLKYLLG
jgi:thiosulfate dehydrogenase [quinone] large subunit